MDNLSEFVERDADKRGKTVGPGIRSILSKENNEKSSRSCPSGVGRSGRKKEAEEWIKKNLLAEKEAQIVYKQEVAKSKKENGVLPNKPKTIWEELLPLQAWEIHEGNVMLTLEVANALLQEENFELTMEIVDMVGQRFSDESQALAAEIGGDLYHKMRFLDKSMEFYEFSLKVLEALKKKVYNLGKGERIFFSEEQKVLLSRIHNLLS